MMNTKAEGGRRKAEGFWVKFILGLRPRPAALHRTGRSPARTLARFPIGPRAFAGSDARRCVLRIPRSLFEFLAYPSSFILCCALAAGTALAQQYPSRPVRAIVPFAAAGPTDYIARIVAQKLSETWGQQFVVDNRAGAGGNIGMGIAANSAADGYTVIFVSSSLMVNPSLYKTVPYDPYRSFAPISNIAASPHVFFTHPSLPVKSIAELIDAVKKDAKKYSIASPGIGTVPHLSGILLALDAKIDLVVVPYAGGGPSIAAVVGNQVPFGCQAIPPVTPHIKAGRVRALAMTSDKRSEIVPDVPTMAELGFKGHESDTITGMLAPAGTPAAIVRKLHAETVRVILSPEVKSRIAEQGYNIIVSSPREFTEKIKVEVAKWGKVIKDAKIVVN